MRETGTLGEVTRFKFLIEPMALATGLRGASFSRKTPDARAFDSQRSSPKMDGIDRMVAVDQPPGCKKAAPESRIVQIAVFYLLVQTKKAQTKRRSRNRRKQNPSQGQALRGACLCLAVFLRKNAEQTESTNYIRRMAHRRFRIRFHIHRIRRFRNRTMVRSRSYFHSCFHSLDASSVNGVG